MASIKGSESLDDWRQFFATAKNSSVFDILEQAITIAATDYPDEFKTQKTRILNSIQGLAAADRVSDRAVRKPHIIRIKIPQRYKDQKAKEAKETSMEAKKPCSAEPKVINKVAMDDKEIREKVEASKRKIHDRYEEFDKARRQKRIQVIDYIPQQNFKLGCSKPKPQANKISCLQQKRVVKNPRSQLHRFASC